MLTQMTTRVERLEAARGQGADAKPMPPGLFETMLRSTVETFSDYPRGSTDTLADGLARVLGYADRAEADAAAEHDRDGFDERMATIWPRLVEHHTAPRRGTGGIGDNPTFLAWVGILERCRHYKRDECPTADQEHLPNGLPLFDYTAPSVKAAFLALGTTPDAVREVRHERH